MKLRRLSNLFLLLSLVLAGTAVYAYFFLQDAPGAVIDEPDREFPALATRSTEVRFVLHNPTRHTVRVVGCQFC